MKMKAKKSGGIRKSIVVLNLKGSDSHFLKSRESGRLLFAHFYTILRFRYTTCF